MAINGKENKEIPGLPGNDVDFVEQIKKRKREFNISGICKVLA
jgi:hypothetical protein